MAQPNDPFATNSTLAPSVRDRWGYLALFGAQTIGAFVLLWTGLRLYREVLADPTSHELHPWRFVNSLSSIALMQGSYWVSYRVRPPLPQFQNALLGHAILFLARLGFVLPTSIFGFLFVAQRPEFEIPVYQYLIILLGLFSILLRAEAGAPGSRFHRLRKGPRCQRRLALHANRARRMSAICALLPLPAHRRMTKIHPLRKIPGYNGHAFSSKRSANCFNPRFCARLDAEAQAGA